MIFSQLSSHELKISRNEFKRLRYQNFIHLRDIRFKSKMMMT